MTKLPEWFLKELPEIEEPATLLYRDGKYVAVAPGGEEKFFETLDESYNYINGQWNLEVEFDKSLPEVEDDEFRSEDLNFVFGKSDEKGSRQLFASNPDARKLASFEETYNEFLKVAEKLGNNPGDFATAYNFVDAHPAFWNRPSKENPWTWMTVGHCSAHNGRLSLDPFFEEDGSYIWKIETGSHVDDDYSGRYYDYRLDSYGKTVEEAYINLAQLIDKFYNNDGTEKEEVPHIKPKWIIDLEKSTAKHSENKEEEMSTDE